MQCDHQDILLHRLRLSPGANESAVSISDELVESSSPSQVDFKSCRACGANVHTEGSKAVKDLKDCFEADVSPSELLHNALEDQKKYAYPSVQDCKEYLKERPALINVMFEIGKRFKQRDETTHLAVDLIDRFFISSGKKEFSAKLMALYECTCFMIASKYEELDENITLIKDLIRYFTRILPNSVAPPTFNEVVECERELMVFYNWDLMIVTPTVLTKLLIANGVVFDNESFGGIPHRDVAKKVSEKSTIIVEQLTRELYQFMTWPQSQLSAAIIYSARKEECSAISQKLQFWCPELETLTKYSEEDLLEISDKFDKVFGAKIEPKRSYSKNKENNHSSSLSAAMQNKISPKKSPFGEANSQGIKSQKQSNPQTTFNTQKSISPRYKQQPYQPFVKQSKNSPFKNNTNIQPSGEKSLNQIASSQIFPSKHYEYTSQSKPPTHYNPPSFHRSITGPPTLSNNSYYNGIQRAQSSNYTALNIQQDSQNHYPYSSHPHQEGNAIDDSKFVPLRMKQSSTNGAVSKLAPPLSTKNEHLEDRKRQDSHLSRQYMQAASSLTREYDVSKLSSQIVSRDIIKSNDYSRMPHLTKDSADYSSSGTQQSLSIGLHTTRVPPQMRAGLTNRVYENQTRESSLGKLPAIDVAYRPPYNPPVTGGRSNIPDPNEVVFNPRRSKSWRRSEEELNHQNHQVNLRMGLRKESFGYQQEETANSSRFGAGYHQQHSNAPGVYQTTRTNTGGGTGATCDAPSVKSYAKVY